MQFRNEIQALEIHTGFDSWQQTDPSSGICTLASAWEATREKKQQFQFYMWIPNSSPEMSVYALGAIHNKLQTSDFLLSTGVVHANTCLMLECPRK